MDKLTDKISRFLQKNEKLIIILIFTFFIFRGLELAFTILPFIPPDEKYHIDLIKLFSYRFWFIQQSDIGDVGFSGLWKDIPFLYHFLLGKLLWLKPPIIETYVYLRLINLAFSTLTVFIAYKSARLFFNQAATIIAFLLILTNIPIFSFMSAAVSYDNLVNLCTAGAFYYFCLYVRRQNAKYALLVLSLLGIAMLSKFTVVPLMAICTVLMLYEFAKSKAAVLASINQQQIMIRILLLLTICIGALNAYLYGGNLIRYHKLIPHCQDISSAERCDNTTFYQNVCLEELTNGNIDNPIPAPIYLALTAVVTTNNVLHQGGHINFYLPIELGIMLVILITFVTIRIMLKLRTFNKIALYTFAITYGYVGVLMYVQYSSYLRTGVPYSSTEARYLFPVLIPFLITVFSGLKTLNMRTAKVLIALLSVSAVICNYPMLKLYTDYQWTVQWYESDEYISHAVGPYDYLGISTHDGEPYGFEPILATCTRKNL